MKRLLALILMALAACAPQPIVTSAPLIATPLASATPALPQVLPTLTPADLALADLSERLGLPVSDIQVLSSEETELTLADPACQPRSLVEQPAIVFGLRLRLQAAGAVYIYQHHGRVLRFCGTE